MPGFLDSESKNRKVLSLSTLDSFFLLKIQLVATATAFPPNAATDFRRVRRETYFIRLSIDMAQMFLHRLSKLLVVCWMESHSVSLAHASESCSRTSQMLNTDSTPAVCCSMSLCRSCHWQKNSVSGRKCAWLHFINALSKCCKGWGKSNSCVRKSLFSFRKDLQHELCR